jgi:hypothetical protein
MPKFNFYVIDMVSWISLFVSVITALSMYLVVRELYFVKLYATNPRPRAQSQGPIVGSMINGLLPIEVESRMSEATFIAMLFTSSGCSTCRSVRLEELKSIIEAFRETFLILEVTDEIKDRKPELNLLQSYTASENLGIQVVPHLLILNQKGVVLKNLLVNNPAQVETAISFSEKKQAM